MEINRVVCADCVDFMSTMDKNSADLTVTSPPYDNLRDYNGYTFDVEKVADGLFDVTKEGGVVVWVVGDKVIKGSKSLTSFKHAFTFRDVGFNIHDVMIYQKKNTPFPRSNGYTNAFEYMFIFSKGKVKTFNPLKTKTVDGECVRNIINRLKDGSMRYTANVQKRETKTLTNIWSYAVGLGGTTNDKFAFKHPAMFPEKLAQDHILSWSNEGDLVFDPMCGAGTTLKMAKLNRRNYLGCDISEEYCEIARDRATLTIVESNEKKNECNWDCGV